MEIVVLPTRIGIARKAHGKPPQPVKTMALEELHQNAEMEGVAVEGLASRYRSKQRGCRFPEDSL